MSEGSRTVMKEGFHREYGCLAGHHVSPQLFNAHEATLCSPPGQSMCRYRAAPLSCGNLCYEQQARGRAKRRECIMEAVTSVGTHVTAESEDPVVGRRMRRICSRLVDLKANIHYEPITKTFMCPVLEGSGPVIISCRLLRVYSESSQAFSNCD